MGRYLVLLFMGSCFIFLYRYWLVGKKICLVHMSLFFRASMYVGVISLLTISTSSVDQSNTY